MALSTKVCTFTDIGFYLITLMKWDATLKTIKLPIAPLEREGIEGGIMYQKMFLIHL